MNWIEINLARDLVYPAKKRRILYRGMIAYLFVMIILLALTAGKASVDIREGLVFRQRAAQIQKRFATRYPQERSLRDCATRLKNKLLKNETEATAISEALPEKVRTMLPLMVSLINQPNAGTLYKLSFIQKLKNTHSDFEFSICTSAAQQNARQLWQKDALLSRQFSAIVPTTTKRGRVDKRDVLIMSYKAVFRE